MAITALNTIKNWFKTGLKPTQAQFWATWDSFWHKDDKIPVTSVDRLPYYLDQKADQQAFQNHLNDENAHPYMYAALAASFQIALKVVVITSDTVLGPEHQGAILCIEGTVVLTIPLDLESNFVSCVIDVISGSCTIAAQITPEAAVQINGGASLILTPGGMTSLYKYSPTANIFRMR
jgi:hypothetical protein